jgi:hypothetical protein
VTRYEGQLRAPELLAFLQRFIVGSVGAQGGGGSGSDGRKKGADGATGRGAGRDILASLNRLSLDKLSDLDQEEDMALLLLQAGFSCYVMMKPWIPVPPFGCFLAQLSTTAMDLTSETVLASLGISAYHVQTPIFGSGCERTIA